MEKIQVLGICGSLRKSSANMGLLRYAQEAAPQGLDIQIADISGLPFYNSDMEEKPQSVLDFFKALEKADALLLACPEYNYSMAPALKNALDWASREPDNALLSGKTAAIMGAGGGMGTARAQYHLRQVCVFLNLHVLNAPEVFCNAFAGGFEDNGNLKDEKIQKQIGKLLTALKDWTLKLR
ncbi:NAD(P)H-dependent FMN reductase [Desulfobotulus alkaliphilus]|uniref:NAD(P)H-dependent FMN reductase n=1 Tax=Desulfobotulus alkaliphilus TaxID=622671 RepID=A0A562RYV4_9BACT|nr:NADPH-dependent FMN reductase [Desulfobotulus alkaliphilus]TWI74309.1 NAD(P)H-dependent FMN reductase [Desulfobotulus alkaliphilus]